MARSTVSAEEYKCRPKKENKPNPENFVCPDEIEKKEEVEKNKDVEAYVKLIKLKTKEQILVGVVLEPEVFDAHGTFISKAVIKKAAQKFLARYNKKTKIGLQHEDFTKPFELYQSFIAPCDFAIGDKIVKDGSWVIEIKVLDSKIWKSVEEGKITGFSIGGKARVKSLEEEGLNES